MKNKKPPITFTLLAAYFRCNPLGTYGIRGFLITFGLLSALFDLSFSPRLLSQFDSGAVNTKLLAL